MVASMYTATYAHVLGECKLHIFYRGKGHYYQVLGLSLFSSCDVCHFLFSKRVARALYNLYNLPMQ